MLTGREHNTFHQRSDPGHKAGRESRPVEHLGGTGPGIYPASRPLPGQSSPAVRGQCTVEWWPLSGALSRGEGEGQMMHDSLGIM